MAFDPRDAKEPNKKAALKDRKVGGLGIHLVKNLMDRIEYLDWVNQYDGVDAKFTNQVQLRTIPVLHLVCEFSEAGCESSRQAVG